MCVCVCVCVLQMSHDFHVTDFHNLQEWCNSESKYCSRTSVQSLPFCPPTRPKQTLAEGSAIALTFLSSWEGGDYVGLTGLELLDSSDCPIPLSPSQLHASSGSESVGRLVDGENVTACDKHMWVASCDGSCVSVTISLSEPRPLSGIRVWNYNRPAEEAYRGVSSFSTFLLIKLLLIAPSTCNSGEADGCTHQWTRDLSQRRISFETRYGPASYARPAHVSCHFSQVQGTTIITSRSSSPFPRRISR